jgi:molybdenum cofactor biosynthesis protein B
MSQVVDEHRGTSPSSVGCAVTTISDTRTIETDSGGQTLVDLLTAAGHVVLQREIVRDDGAAIEKLVKTFVARADVQAVLLTGGTGVASRDHTFETLSSLIEKPMSGYGELFRILSYQEIGPAAMLSRATAGLIGPTFIATMPGSPTAVRLAMEKLLLPELGHIVREANR